MTLICQSLDIRYYEVQLYFPCFSFQLNNLFFKFINHRFVCLFSISIGAQSHEYLEKTAKTKELKDSKNWDKTSSSLLSKTTSFSSLHKNNLKKQKSHLKQKKKREKRSFIKGKQKTLRS